MVHCRGEKVRIDLTINMKDHVDELSRQDLFNYQLIGVVSKESSEFFSYVRKLING